jgi:hypothetical protein
MWCLMKTLLTTTLLALPLLLTNPLAAKSSDVFADQGPYASFSRPDRADLFQTSPNATISHKDIFSKKLPGTLTNQPDVFLLHKGAIPQTILFNWPKNHPFQP